MNPLKMAKDILATEGVAGLYAGLSASLMRQMSYGTARLGLHRTFSNYMKDSIEGDVLPAHLKIASSMSSGAIASVIGNPFDVALVRMQSDSLKPVAERRNYSGIFNAITRVISEEGVKTLYRGVGPTVARAMAMNTGMLASYDTAREMITAINGENFTTSLMSSGIAGISCALASLPFDMIKTRLQNMKIDPKTGEYPYRGVVHCASSIVRSEGVFALWTGLGPYIMRCSPHAMTILIIMEPLNRTYSSIFGTEFKR